MNIKFQYLILGTGISLGLLSYAVIAKNNLSVTITFSESNYAFFQEIALPEDRLLYFRQQVLQGERWPPQLGKGKIVTTWPSWLEARGYETIWAPYTDVFGYDIEGDSPPEEIADVARTISELQGYLGELQQRFGHAIRLSVGLNYQFGTYHAQALAQAEELHIHANQLLRIYPARDPKGLDYVDWAIARALEVRAINPAVRIRFAVLVPQMATSTAIAVAERLISSMQQHGMGFDGFTMWAEKDNIKTFLQWLRGYTSVSTMDLPEFGQPRLSQNYPNPFNAITTFHFYLPASSYVSLKVYDIMGKEVATVVDGYLDSGEHRGIFDATALPSGLYFYKLITPKSVQTKFMALIK